jgi:hypothetical protein
MIAKKAGLNNVDWDGYLKHFKPHPRLIDEQRKNFAADLIRLMNFRHHVRSQSADANLSPAHSPQIKPTHEGSGTAMPLHNPVSFIAEDALLKRTPFRKRVTFEDSEKGNESE